MKKTIKKIKKIIHWCWATVPRRIVCSVLVALLIIGPISFIFTRKEAKASWWNETWYYRKSIAVSNPSGSILTNFQVKVLAGVDLSADITAGKIQADLDDLRFTDINGQILTYWIEDTTGSSVDAWVLMPSIPTSGATVYMYYGNATAISESSKSNTMVVDTTTGFKSPVPKGTLSNGNRTWSAGLDYSSVVLNKTFAGQYFEMITYWAHDYRGVGMVYGSSVSHADWTGWSADSAGPYWGALNTSGFPSGYSGTYFGAYMYDGATTPRWFKHTRSGNTISVQYSDVSTSGPWTNVVSDGTVSSSDKVAIGLGEASSVEVTPLSIQSLYYSQSASSAPSVVSPTNEEKSPAPVGYWKFDEGSGTTANDSSGRGKNGTFWSVPIWKTEDQCVSGKCLAFDNVDDGVGIENENFASLTDYTMCSWINLKGTHQHYTGTIMSSGDWNVNHWAFGVDQNNTQIQTRKADGTNSPAWNYAFSLNQWTHVCITRSGSTITAYANGKQVGSPFSGTTGNLVSNATNTAIGRETYAGGYFAFNGWIDEPKIYNYARTAAEIKTDYNSGKAGAGTTKGTSVSAGSKLGAEASASYGWGEGPMAYYKMDEGTGSTLRDSSGNGYDSSTFDNPTWIAGKVGKALSFDGNDYVNTSFPAQTLPAFTVGAWVNPSSNANWRAILQSADAGDRALYLSNGYLHYYAACNSSSAVPLNQWSYVAVSIDENNVIKYYINGVAAGGCTSTSNPRVFEYLHISGTATGDPENFQGKIDDVKLYNYVRTLKQIVEDMNAGHSATGGSVGSQVGYWKFDEGKGTAVYDSGPNHYNGSFVGSPTWTNDGKVNKAINFNNGGNYGVNFGDQAGLDMGTDNFTMSSWVNIADTSSDVIVEKRGAGLLGYLLSVNYPGAGQVSILLNDGGSGDQKLYTFTSAGLNNLNTWYHLSVVVNRTSNQALLYINGVWVQTLDISATSGNIDSDGNFYLGLDLGGSTFYGKLDEVKIYRYALTGDEIKLDYNKGSAVKMGSTGTTSAGVADNSATGEYCVPGDSASCSAPIAEWKMDEKIGTTVGDTSGNGYTGTLSGATWTKGKIGSGLSFDGSDDYVTLASTINLGDTDWTVSAWMKTSNSGFNTLLSNSSGGPVSNDLRIYDSKISYAHYDGSWKYEYGTSNVADGNWHFLTWANHSNQTMDFYVDGRKEVAGVASAAGNGSVNQIGRNWTITANAVIDQVRVYNYARTPAQVAYDYNRGGPVGWWKFDECQGAIAHDASGNGNNGTITIGASGTNTSLGTCTGSAGEAWKDGAAGKYSSSIEFDGTDDYVSATPPVSGITQGTLSCWVKLNALGSYADTPIGIGNAGAGKWRIDVYSSGAVAADFWTDGNATSNTGVISTGTWYHLVSTFDGTTKRMYVNGVQVASAVSSATPVNASTAQISGYTPGGYIVDGKIDDVKIFNYAVTAAQVKILFNEGSVIRFGP